MTEKGPEPLSASLAHHALLGSSIPALIHRANNCLSVIDGTLELVSGVDAEDKKLAQEQSAILRDLLRHLGVHSRHELQETGEIELTHVLHEAEFLLAMIGRFRRCDVELHTNVEAATLIGDQARLYRLLVSLGTERIAAMDRTEQPGCLLRLSFTARGDRGRLLLVDGAGAIPFDPRFWEGLAGEAAAMGELWGYALTRRRIGNGHAIRIDVPLLSARDARTEGASARRSDRILLLQPTGEEAELNVALLSERGYRVEHVERCDDDAEHFDLVLCDETLFPALPAVRPPVLVLGASVPDPKVFGAVQKPVRPQDLLDRIGAALL